MAKDLAALTNGPIYPNESRRTKQVKPSKTDQARQTKQDRPSKTDQARQTKQDRPSLAEDLKTSCQRESPPAKRHLGATQHFSLSKKSDWSLKSTCFRNISVEKTQ
jgi:hypothetical protein